MSRLKPRPMPTFQDLLKQQSTRPDGEGRVTRTEQSPEKEMTVAVQSEKIPVAVRDIIIPKFWPNMETIIQVQAKVNWLKQINESEYEAGVTFMGKYPYNSDCQSIWKLKKIGEKFVPVCDLLNNKGAKEVT